MSLMKWLWLLYLFIWYNNIFWLVFIDLFISSWSVFHLSVTITFVFAINDINKRIDNITYYDVVMLVSVIWEI